MRLIPSSTARLRRKLYRRADTQHAQAQPLLARGSIRAGRADVWVADWTHTTRLSALQSLTKSSRRAGFPACVARPKLPLPVPPPAASAEARPIP